MKLRVACHIKNSSSLCFISPVCHSHSISKHQKTKIKCYYKTVKPREMQISLESKPTTTEMDWERVEMMATVIIR